MPINSNAHNVVDNCSAKLERDTLTVENSYLQYRWLWDGGRLIPCSILDKCNNRVLNFANRESDCPVSQQKEQFIKNIEFKINNIDSSYMSPKALEIEIINQYANFQHRRRIKVFAKTSTISFDNAFKYTKLGISPKESATNADGIEEKLLKSDKQADIYITDYHFNQKHWRYRSVNFKDITDQNNNLLSEQCAIPYNKPERYTGNLIWAENLLSGFKFFVLKEAPNSTSQIEYPGYDFAISSKRISIPISGIEESSDGESFVSTYTITLGIVDQQTDGLASLRRYLKQSIPYNTLTHDMILMNTWGDRGKDGRISEQFILNEIDKASKLGITHFQIDDGWQQGASANSAFKNQNQSWDSWSADNWRPNQERFPNGLEPIVKLAKEKNIELGLWFNPSKEEDYKSWKRDADIIVNLYKSYGIKYYKIDGVAIPTKQAAINFERFLKSVKERSNGEVFFNLDLTAGIRGGYFSYRYAGNLFLENRYTDFQNYYPYATLRNLWLLSRYFPAELLQIEFLNKWRNRYVYPREDIFAPYNYDIDYLFATTMVAQPLAWFEATGLPAEADEVTHLIKKYRAVQSELHSGVTLPIGDEPSGRSWSGFQTIIDDKSGFFLIFRENNEAESAKIETYLKENATIKLSAICGDGDDIECNIDSDNRAKFTLEDKNSFVLFRYQVAP